MDYYCSIQISMETAKYKIGSHIPSDKTIIQVVLIDDQANYISPYVLFYPRTK